MSHVYVVSLIVLGAESKISKFWTVWEIVFSLFSYYENEVFRMVAGHLQFFSAVVFLPGCGIEVLQKAGPFKGSMLMGLVFRVHIKLKSADPPFT